jgi:polygalacturonase
LKSSVILHLHGGARLLGSRDVADYPDVHPATDNTQLKNCRKALLYADNAHDVHITGTGVIDGDGTASKWQGSSRDNPESTRPMAVFLTLSHDVSIENVTVRNSAMWAVVNMEVDRLAIKNVTVDSTHGSTRDGIDIVDCHHVTIEDCTVKSGDDGICLKSGTERGVDDVVVRRSHVLTAGVANGLKLGTASYGPFTNITFDTIDVSHADKAAMAVESVDGAKVENVVFRNITFTDVGTPVFVLIGDRGLRPEHVERRIGSVNGVRFEHIRGNDVRHDWGSIISGLEAPDGTIYPVQDLAFDDVRITTRGGASAVPKDPPEYAGEYPDPNLWGRTPAAGLFVRHASGVALGRSNVDVWPNDSRPRVVFRDASNVTVDPID